MGIWTAINPWGALREAEFRLRIVRETNEFLSEEVARLQGKAVALERELNTANLRAKMQKDSIIALTAENTDMKSKAEKSKQPRLPNGRYAKAKGAGEK